MGKRLRADSAAELREQCRSVFDTALGLLIDRRWLEQEADRLGVQLDEAAMRANVRARYERAFGGAGQGEQPSGDAAQSPRRALPFMRQTAGTAVLRRQVREKLLARGGGISDADVERYYERYPLRVAQPATRKVRVLAAPTDARARQALQALRSGRGWQRLATKLTVDENTITSPAGRTTLSEDSGDAALLEAVFSTAPGRVGGPVRTLNGRFVFAVDAATPRSSTPATARRAVRRLLEAQLEARVGRDFTTRYVRETVCHRGYRALPCGNR